MKHGASTGLPDSAPPDTKKRPERRFFYRFNSRNAYCTVGVSPASCSDLLKAQYDFITNLFILNRWAGRPPQESVDSVNVWLGGANPAVEKAAESALKKKP